MKKYGYEQRIIPILIEQRLINEELDHIEDYFLQGGVELENS